MILNLNSKLCFVVLNYYDDNKEASATALQHLLAAGSTVTVSELEVELHYVCNTANFKEDLHTNFSLQPVSVKDDGFLERYSEDIVELE